MNRNLCWPILVGDTLAIATSAVVPERTLLGLLMLGFSLVMSSAPTAIRVARWWSNRLLGDDMAA